MKTLGYSAIHPNNQVKGQQIAPSATPRIAHPTGETSTSKSRKPDVVKTNHLMPRSYPMHECLGNAGGPAALPGGRGDTQTRFFEAPLRKDISILLSLQW